MYSLDIKIYRYKNIYTNFDFNEKNKTKTQKTFYY
jgi:hypothetical protein